MRRSLAAWIDRRDFVDHRAAICAAIAASQR
jgi:hypothetical protein